KAREVADSQQPCSGSMRSLRSYNFEYQNDADTGQFQLRRVTMIGQENTPERNVTLPVATYTYGQVTGSDGKLSYQMRQRITPLPAGVDTSFAISSTSNGTTQDGTSVSTSLQNLLDVNGDGRPDLLYPYTGSEGFTAALNKPDPANPKSSLFTPIFVPPRPGGGDRFGSYQTQSRMRQMDVDGSGNSSQVWVQMIDVKADGRVDVVVANEISNFWVVHLNKPDPQDPSLIVWETSYIDIRPLLQYLPRSPGDGAVAVVEPPFYDHGVLLALSSTVSGHGQAFNHCWQG